MIFKIKIVTVFLFISTLINGQKPFKSEIYWGLWHPFAAIKVKRMYSKLYAIYNQETTKTALDNYNNGGKLDAFRHAFFMAALAQKIKVKKIRKLGIAHEKGNYHQFLKHKTEEGELPDSLSSVMDLYNNEVGLKIGFANKKINLEKLQELVIWKIKTGNAAIIKRNKQGLYVECDDKIIDMQLYKGKWFVPKCLVPSN